MKNATIGILAISAAAAAGVHAAPPPAPQDETAVRALIQRQSQEFSDASASGDRDVLARYLDDRVVFINESGEVATKADLVAGAGPMPAGLHNVLKQVDFHVELFGGDTAVTSFKDLSTLDFHGQVVHATYLSTEVWHRDANAWHMVSSQTLAVPEDPPAIELDARSLDDYVGNYEAGPGYALRVTRNGGDLMAAVNDGAPAIMKAEARDVFFVPGVPRLRRVFQRGTGGKVTGFLSRREGHDIVLRRVS
jgi:ketosteroid isomerase-like protein